MSAINVYYDQQEGSYFKIDKQTGHFQKAHRNGSGLIKFKPEYSGANYRMRKDNQKDFSPKYLNRPAFQINHENKYPTSKEKQSKLRRQTKSVATLHTFLNTDTTHMAGYSSRILQSRMTKIENNLQQKLRDFCKIKQQLRKQNHSPRKGYEGSLECSKICGEFQNQILANKIIPEKKRVKKMITLDNSLSPSLSKIALRNQLHKQKQIFLRYNSSYKPQQNERQQKQLKQRKTNLKILENLFICRNNKETNIVYG